MSEPPECGPPEGEKSRAALREFFEFGQSGGVIGRVAPVFAVLFGKGEDRAVERKFIAPPGFASEDDALVMRHHGFEFLLGKREAMVPEIFRSDRAVDDRSG